MLDGGFSIGLGAGVEGIRRASKWGYEKAQAPFIRGRKLTTYSPALARHSNSDTFFENYHDVHSSANASMASTNGLMISVTYLEFDHLWANPEKFASYEALHYHSQRTNAFKVQRVFVLPETIRNPIIYDQVRRVLLRHHKLGFETRVIWENDIGLADNPYYVDCDSFFTINGKTASFIKFNGSLDANMIETVTTTHQHFAQGVHDIIYDIWKKAAPFDVWSKEFKRPDWALRKEIRKEIDLITKQFPF